MRVRRFEASEIVKLVRLPVNGRRVDGRSAGNERDAPADRVENLAAALLKLRDRKIRLFDAVRLAGRERRQQQKQPE